jgi:hypothetical protein
MSARHRCSGEAVVGAVIIAAIGTKAMAPEAAKVEPATDESRR